MPVSHKHLYKKRTIRIVNIILNLIIKPLCSRSKGLHSSKKKKEMENVVYILVKMIRDLRGSWNCQNRLFFLDLFPDIKPDLNLMKTSFFLLQFKKFISWDVISEYTCTGTYVWIINYLNANLWNTFKFSLIFKTIKPLKKIEDIIKKTKTVSAPLV